MINSRLEQLQSKVNEFLKKKGLQNLENPLSQLIKQGLQGMEFVTLEEFETQREVLHHLREKVKALEIRVNELENKPPQ
jgi:BMFP domain-containing protein YqiC